MMIPAIGTNSDDLTQAQNDALGEALLALFRAQARAYTLGDSDSLPLGTANELMASLLYTLDVHPAQPESFRPLIGRDLQALYRDALRRLEEKQRRALALAQSLCLSTPDYGCIALRDTLHSIQSALPGYDARFFAHRIPGEIDYQLAEPVPESLLGVDYILEYLLRLRAELRLLSRFYLPRVLALLSGAQAEWRELVSNLYLPVAANALGLSLLGENPRRLHVRREERRALLALLAPLHPLDAQNQMERACPGLLAALDLREPRDAQALRALCRDLAPRAACAAASGDLSGVFPSFGMPERA